MDDIPTVPRAGDGQGLSGLRPKYLFPPPEEGHNYRSTRLAILEPATKKA